MEGYAPWMKGVVVPCAMDELRLGELQGGAANNREGGDGGSMTRKAPHRAEVNAADGRHGGAEGAHPTWRDVGGATIGEVQGRSAPWRDPARSREMKAASANASILGTECERGRGVEKKKLGTVVTEGKG